MLIWFWWICISRNSCCWNRGFFIIWSIWIVVGHRIGKFVSVLRRNIIMLGMRKSVSWWVLVAFRMWREVWWLIVIWKLIWSLISGRGRSFWGFARNWLIIVTIYGVMQGKITVRCQLEKTMIFKNLFCWWYWWRDMIDKK